MIRDVLMVGHYVEPPWCDGVVNTVKNWSEGLAKSGLKVNVLSTTSDPVRKRLTFGGVQYNYFFGSRTRFQYRPFIYEARFHCNLINYLRKNDVDICHLHGLRSSSPTLLKFFSKGVFGFSFYNMKQVTAYSFVKKLMVRTFDFLTVLDNRGSSFLIKSGLPKEKIGVIPPAINTDFFKPKNCGSSRSVLGIPKDEFVIMYAGHFKRGRGLKELLSTFYRLKKCKVTTENLRLVFAWTGHTENGYYEKLLREIRDKSSVVIIGPQSDMSMLYNSVDVVVSPILRDDKVISIPLNIIEAMACGKIVVSTDVGAISDFLIDGFNGFLIKPRDSEAMFKKLSIILDGSFNRQRMENLARETAVKNFSVDGVAKKLINLYESSVNK